MNINDMDILHLTLPCENFSMAEKFSQTLYHQIIKQLQNVKILITTDHYHNKFLIFYTTNKFLKDQFIKCNKCDSYLEKFQSKTFSKYLKENLKFLLEKNILYGNNVKKLLYKNSNYENIKMIIFKDNDEYCDELIDSSDDLIRVESFYFSSSDESSENLFNDRTNLVKKLIGYQN